MRPSPYDLFGEVPVTQPEIDAWVRVIAKLEPGTPRAAYYIKGWNVPEKIRAAKIRGSFEDDIAPPAPGWRRPG